MGLPEVAPGRSLAAVYSKRSSSTCSRWGGRFGHEIDRGQLDVLMQDYLAPGASRKPLFLETGRGKTSSSAAHLTSTQT